MLFRNIHLRTVLHFVEKVRIIFGALRVIHIVGEAFIHFVMQCIQVRELLHVHEVVWQVHHIPHATHDVVGLHVIRIDTTSILASSVGLSWYMAKLIIDIIEETILTLEEVGYQI
jgi:hypothetical protein